MAYAALPPDGVMMLHTIVQASVEELKSRGLKLPAKLLKFVLFIMDEIFPGGELPLVAQVRQHAVRAGFHVSRVQPLQPHYARTLDIWADTLQRNREQAVAVQSQEVYDRYMKYLTGCADLFRDGYIDVCQFTLNKSG
jgi:cyclopropane-fatty-acyl-phospholipid synthase